MASDFVPNLLNIMDVTEMVETVKTNTENMKEPMEKMEWDMELVVMQEELKSTRTCVPGHTLDP
eukprot:4179037-Heterocapsa_arctica.AAC.1